MKKRTVYRVRLPQCVDEWPYESKKKKKAVQWLKDFLKTEKESGYKYRGKIYKVIEEPLLKMKNY